MGEHLDPVWTWVAIGIGAAVIPIVFIVVEVVNALKKSRASAERLHDEHVGRRDAHKRQVENMQADREA